MSKYLTDEELQLMERKYFDILDKTNLPSWSFNFLTNIVTLLYSAYNNN